MNTFTNVFGLCVICNSHLCSHKRKRARAENLFASNMAKHGEQLDSPSLSERGHKQVPKALISKWKNGTMLDMTWLYLVWQCKAVVMSTPLGVLDRMKLLCLLMSVAPVAFVTILK